MNQRKMRGRSAYHAGESAELQVARAYERRGGNLLQHRWRGPGGEVDLILRDRDELVFVEVKQSRTLSQAACRVSRRQMDRICATASAFLDQEPAGQLSNTRFDVALVDGCGAIEIIENAFGMT